ncbi:MAG TPA: shikimate dehydrogenase [Streptosporangiaceae bacterium]|nr:shikimate dehydrogenase [Streptosporangiaceae bacterium]
MKAAVLGSPIAHSLSPSLHQAGYLALGLTGWTYQALECDEAALPGFLASCGPDWAGLSLTMPLKRAVLPLLDRIEPLAAEVGAANTVIFAAGRRHGHNTDVPGLLAALAERGVTRTSLPPSPTALILGAGATACSALAALRALGITQATVAARDPARTTGLLAAADRLGAKITLTPFDIPHDPPDLLISAVPAGAADPYAQQIAARTFAPPRVLDIVYHPWPTPLATAARQTGAAVADGFDLLLHQAAGQFQLMTGHPAPLEPMRTAGLAAIEQRR